MCGKLEEKYGESPEAFLAEEEEPAADEPKADEKEEAPKAEEKEEKSEKKKTPRSKAAKKLRREALDSSKLRRRILKTFYAKHAPEKTAEDVAAVIEKRSSRGDGWFDDLIGKLAEKYSKDPRAVYQEQLDAKTGPEPEPEPEPEGGAALRLWEAETPQSLRASATPPGSPRPKTPRGSEADDSDKMRVCLRVRPLNPRELAAQKKAKAKPSMSFSARAGSARPNRVHLGASLDKTCALPAPESDILAKPPCPCP